MGFLSNLNDALTNRFEKTGSRKDLEDAIMRSEEAIRLSPPNYPYRVMYLSGLGKALLRRFEVAGRSSDLDRAITLQNEAVESTALDHPDRIMYLNSLGGALRKRHEVTGSIDDLNSAIMRNNQAVEQSSPVNPFHNVYLNSLGNALKARFRRTLSIDDLDRAVMILEQAVRVTPVHQPHRATYLNNLSVAFKLRFETLRSMADLDSAIKYAKEATKSERVDNLYEAMCQNTLADVLYTRYQIIREPDDLHQAMVSIETAVGLTPVDHPTSAIYRTHLGVIMQNRFEETGSTNELNRAITAFEEAAKSYTSAPSARLMAAQLCSNLLISQRTYNRAKSILDDAVHLLPEVSPRQLNRGDQQFNISKVSNIPSRAVSLHLADADDPFESLQLLELGRGVISNLQFEVRSDISDLESSHPILAKRFRELRDHIDSPPGTVAQHSVSNPIQKFIRESSKAVNARRALLQEFDDLLKRIRSMKGWENFLRGPSRSELCSLAENGPIVVFNISDIRADAFVVTTKEIRSVHLPSITPTLLSDFTRANIRNASRQLSSTNTQPSVCHGGDPRMDMGRDAVVLSSGVSPGYTPQMILERLWEDAVEPVLKDLKFLGTPDDDKWPHVWWVTSGLLARLPLHAAGYHTDGENNAMDRVISSYIPSLKSLVYARKKTKNWSKEVQKFLLVAMPVTAGHTGLPGTAREITEIDSLLPHDNGKTILIEPTKSEVLQALVQCHIAHFACHGESNITDPSSSRLLLKDWEKNPLSVEEISKLTLEKAQFVYLSACSAADNKVKELLDEGIHLTGACQLAGFPSVVGTLWHISDQHSVEIASYVYREMRGTSDKIDPSRAAAALHSATRALRNKLGTRGESPLLWAPYIHMGV